MGITAGAPVHHLGAGQGNNRPMWPCTPFLSMAPPLALKYQQTRVQKRLIQAGDALAQWATNPWRRLSLSLIVLLVSFGIGGGLGTITGALSYFDQLSALICVLALEMAARCRPWLLKRPRDQRLGLQLLDMARIGLLYGLLLDGFKLQ
jgi:hypothetical protein